MRWSWILGCVLCVGCGGGGDDDDDEPEIPLDRQDTATQLPIALAGSLQNAAWSPESDAVLGTRFSGGYNVGPADLFVVDLPDGDPRTLVSDGSDNVNLPGSSWNGATGAIVFSSSRDPHDEIFSIDGDGAPGTEVPITARTDFVAYEPTLSPDGTWVVFESHVLDQEDNGVVMKAPVDGSSDPVALTAAGGDCRQPNWAPAGGLILYQQLTAGQWDIWVMNEDGTGARQVTSGPGDKTDASFSPDGAHIVYSSNEGGLDLANLFVVPTAGGASTRVTSWAGYDGAPAWAPDGTRITFESYPGDPDDSPGTSLWIIAAPAL
jgi:TolB protein